MNRFYDYFFLLAGLLFLSHFGSAQAPLVFVPNEGQWKADFLYKGIASYADIYLESTGITYVVGADDNRAKIEQAKESIHPTGHPVVLKYHAYKMEWLQANPKAQAVSSKKQPYYFNYYLGEDPAHWKTEVGVYRNVDYRDLYPNIDVHISSAKGQAKYDFIVRPGGDPAQIKLRFKGVDGVAIRKGDLVLQTSVGTVTELAPYAYQYEQGQLQEVTCRYQLSSDGVLRFQFPKGYNPEKNLIIDPTIVFATLTGSTADNWGFTATYDEQGNLYAGGIASGLGYPTTLGAFQVSFGGGSPALPWDISISKFNASGTALVYSTYLGGNGDEMPHSLIVDASGNLILAGKSLSTDFPTTSGAFDVSANGGYDVIISKFNASGTALLASTYVGGSSDDGVNISPSFSGNQTTIKYNYGDGSRSEVIIDQANNIYLATSTRSTNFPVSASAAKSSLGGSQDGVFLKFNASLTNMEYGTYLGGSDDDAAYVVALDTAETHVFVAGGTSSSDFQPSIMGGGYQMSYQGGLSDGYICRFLNSGSYPLEQGTFVGTSAYDQIYGLKTDLENGVYVVGQTLGNFPVSPGVYSNPGSPQFLMKIDSDLATALFSTVFGSGSSTHPNISPVAFSVDTCKNIYISGWAAPFSFGSSTNNLPVTNDAFQSTTDGSDFYFIVFSQGAASLLFASFFGSPGKYEHVDGGTSRFDPNGVVYQAICASCGLGSAFPATPGAYATQKGSSNCNLGAVKIAFNLGSVTAVAQANPASGCAPLQVQFQNSSTNAISYEWDFGDGTGSSTAATPTHTYDTAGTYTVRLIAKNVNGCKTRDTTYLTVIVRSDTISANFDLTLVDTCTDPKVIFQNTSTTLPGHSLSGAGFAWFFGDGTSFNGQSPPAHPYPNPGSYTVMMIMTEPDACNSPDTVVKVFQFSQNDVVAGFDVPDSLCSGAEIAFTNTSQHATNYHWSFGDGAVATDPNPTHIFPSPGTYTVWLSAFNPNACDRTDSVAKTVTVAQSPTASFSYTPFQSELNVPYSFHNASTHADRYHWDFGDGTESSETNPQHQYNRSGTYTVCLTAYNRYGCEDKTCREIRAEVRPLVDLPSAFSPNGDGENDILYVRGYSIAKMNLKIFNRWGQLVFESSNLNHGWDGTFNGVPQEMDAYAFVLDVTFFDGSQAHKQGSVTLLR